MKIRAVPTAGKKKAVPTAGKERAVPSARESKASCQGEQASVEQPTRWRLKS